MLILIGYQYILRLTAPHKSAAAESESASETLSAGASASAEEIKKNGSIEPLKNPESYSITNHFYEAEFSTLGGTVTKLIFKGDEGKRVITGASLFEGGPLEAGSFGLRFTNEDADLSRTVFSRGETDSQDLSERFVYERAGQYRVEKRYRFDNHKPVIYLDVTIENLSDIEKHFPIELNYGINYDAADKVNLHHAGAAVLSEKIESADVNKIAKKGYPISKPLHWAGVYRKYFTVIVKPEAQTISADAHADGKTLMGYLRNEPLTVAPHAKINTEFLIYAGPQKYETLKSFDQGFEDMLSRGVFGLFKIWLLIGLKFLNQFTHNFGWAIILLTLLIKGLFTPLTHLSFESMKKMQALQPKLKSLQERYKNDAQKLNKEMMELYKRNKVNPMMGCLPILMQVPIFIAFNQVFGETIELKGAPFIGWIRDLSEPDRFFSLPFTLPFLGNAIHLLPILMIGSMVWQQKLTPQAGSTPEQTKMMSFMPIIFGFMFYSMPSGLVLYWFVNNMLSIIHQTIVKRMIVVVHHEDRE